MTGPGEQREMTTVMTNARRHRKGRIKQQQNRSSPRDEREGANVAPADVSDG
jgi:hypothetical protein